MHNIKNKTLISEIVKNGNLFYLSGQIGRDPEIGKFTCEEIEGQVIQVAKNIETVLKNYDMGMENILKANCYLADMKYYARFNKVYARYFVSRPARTCIAVKSLPFDALCEIEVIASEIKD